MKFRKAVEATPHLADKWQPGLQALRAEDKPHVKADDPRKLRGSVDVDTALRSRPEHAQAHRWDFAIGFKHTNRSDEFIYWVETHTGSDKEIGVVLDKLKWLRGWLAGDGQALSNFECDFVWVASGATSFTKRARQVKALALKGLRYAGSDLRIRDTLPHSRRQ